MSVHLQREIEKLKKQVIMLSGTVEANVERAVRALEKADVELAERIISEDEQIDQAEIDVEEDCLKILALHQPVAIDLRLIVAVLKINSDLERIGDEAVNIAGRALKIIAAGKTRENFQLSALAGRVQAMLKKTLDALVNLNPELAREVLHTDDEIDEAVHRVFDQVKREIRNRPEDVDWLIEYMRIYRHLERIADHTTNIAEDVIYMIEGQIVRHQQEI